MIDLLVVVAAIAVVDSINPATVVAALYLATTPRAVWAVLGFAAGAFAVNVLGGLILLAVGAKIVDALPDIGATAQHWTEVAIGAGALVAGVLLWARREETGTAFSRAETAAHRFAPLVGVTVAAIELPTAIPYFAVVAMLAASDQGPPVQVAMIIVFNVIFIAPVLLIAAARALAGRGAVERLERARATALRGSGAAVAVITAAFGLVLLGLGIAGLAGA